MLTHPTLDQLNQLGLLGMAGAFGDMLDADTANPVVCRVVMRQAP